MTKSQAEMKFDMAWGIACFQLKNYPFTEEDAIEGYYRKIPIDDRYSIYQSYDIFSVDRDRSEFSGTYYGHLCVSGWIKYDLFKEMYLSDRGLV